MPDHTSNGMQCQEFDGLLTDALDGVLTGLQLDRFQAHARTCSACGPLFAEVEAGRNWLKDLTEVEPPVSLVTNVLASTTGVDTQRLRVNLSAPQPRVTWVEKAQAWAFEAMQPIWTTVRQPRFAMSFGMAFFSLSVALSVLGVKPADLRQVSLRPATIRHTYYNTQARVVRYYENIRFVYEVESRVRELKRNVTPAEPAPEKKDHKNDTTQQPEQKQERNYSQTENHLILACAPLGPSVVDPSNPDLPVVSVTTYRRFV
ncbi:MAG: zf-HC2 domain-containing protein [Candidatus Sulfotelmatobacter sp.]|mgnify:CR=1 FL=1|jgi:putative zinc finger protein